MARLGRGQPKALFRAAARLVSGALSATGSGNATATGTGAASAVVYNATGSGNVSVLGADTGFEVYAATGAGVASVSGAGASLSTLTAAGTATVTGVGQATVTGPGTIYIQGPITARWLPAMNAPELKIYAYADIYSELGGTLLAGGVKVTGGTVQVDRTNAIRRTASNVTIVPDAAGTLLPTVEGTGILYPKGAEMQLFKGCIYPDGSAEVASLGRFLLEQPVVNHDGTGVTIQSTLKDRAQTVTREPTAYPYATNGVRTADAEILYMLNTYAPRLTQFAFTATGFVPAVQTFLVGFNVWTAVLSIAADAGMELFFDKVGVCTLRPIPDPTITKPSAAYTGDAEGSILLSSVRTLDISNVPNIVCVQSSGSNISPPIQTFWWDTNPASTTYYAAGPVGPLLPSQDISATYPPLMATVTSSAISDLTDAQNMANQAGAGYLGTIEGATFTIRDDPARDADDVITVTDSRAGINVATNYVLDTVTIDMGVGDLQMTGRLAL